MERTAPLALDWRSATPAWKRTAKNALLAPMTPALSVKVTSSTTPKTLPAMNVATPALTARTSQNSVLNVLPPPRAPTMKVSAEPRPGSLFCLFWVVSPFWEVLDGNSTASMPRRALLPWRTNCSEAHKKLIKRNQGKVRVERNIYSYQ